MIHVVSAAIVADRRVMLSQRSPLTSYPWKWCTPGGKLDGDESHRDAITRKLREDLGLELVGGIWRAVYQYDLPSTRTNEMVRVHCYAFRSHDIPSAYAAKCLDGTVGVGWFGQCDLFAIALAPADDANRQAIASLLL